MLEKTYTYSGDLQWVARPKINDASKYHITLSLRYGEIRKV